MIRFMAVFLLLAAHANAEPWIDYEQVLKNEADRVIATTNESGELVRRLDFGNGVNVICTGPEGHADCYGMDSVSPGPVACIFNIYSYLLSFAQNCSEVATAEQRMILEEVYEFSGAWVAENAVPRMDWVVLRDLMAAQVEPWTAARCEEEVEVGHIETIRALANPEMAVELKRMMPGPRLPVLNPCL